MSRTRSKVIPAPNPEAGTGASPLDTSFLETLVGYNARRAALTIIGEFLERMAIYGLRPVDFSVLSVIRHNPGATSRQLCACLGLLPPNLVTMLHQLEQRQVVERRPHPNDGRAVALHLTPQGEALMDQAEATAYQLELDTTAAMTETQRATLKRLLKMVYAPSRTGARPPPAAPAPRRPAASA